MATVADIYHYLDGIAPFRYQESYDNAGILVGDKTMEVNGVMLSLDTTEAVIEEAAAKGCNLVIGHHPIIFSGVKRIDYEHYISRTIVSAIKHDIAIIAIHTNLDNVLQSGVNQRIAEQLGVTNISILNPNKALDDNGTIGSGVIGELDTAQDPMTYLQAIKDNMKAGVVKYTNICKSSVKTVAICGGSGSFLLPTAIAKGADIFITSDFKYHEFFEANDQIIIADIGHYESEQYTVDLLQVLISQKFSNFAIHLTKTVTNPVNYL
jgi:dinuclear metal center YbgI/SA1388 family protein